MHVMLMKINKNILYFAKALLLLCFSLPFLLFSCKDDSFDFNHPDAHLFVSLLKEGDYMVSDSMGLAVLPRFTMDDIEDLLPYTTDLSLIPSFPLAPVADLSGKFRLGECILWTIESIRLGHMASMGCKMVHVGADNYEGIYFLSDNEVLEVSALYKQWWANRKYPRTVWTVDPCFDDPLCGSPYMWW